MGNSVQIEAGRTIPDVCYTGFDCIAGLRGHWLDLTDTVLLHTDGPVYPGAKTRVSIAETGADIRAREQCVPPASKTRQGYVAIRLEDIVTPGNHILEVKRIGNIGLNRHSDSIPLEIRNGGNFLNLSASGRQPFTAPAGQVRELDIAGRGLQQLRVKAGVRQPFPAAVSSPSPGAAPAPGSGTLAGRMAARVGNGTAATLPVNAQQITFDPKPFEIVSARFDSVRIRVNVLRAGTVNLEDYFEFVPPSPGIVVTPAINNDFGWPRIEVQP
ncbi:MAG: hypothetical protein DCF27_03700 [Lysobacteraceae bacterium]|nr:MAG: hypothetical protein DCF27_03700 [Xanthomonadaceae bacterium]